MSRYMPRRCRRISGISSGVAARMMRLVVMIDRALRSNDFTRYRYQLLVPGIFLGELDLGRLEFFLYLRQLVVIDFGRDRLVPLLDGTLPMCRGQLQASGLLIQVAEVLLHRRIGANVLRSFGQG